jgi:hypothetical protein
MAIKSPITYRNQSILGNASSFTISRPWQSMFSWSNARSGTLLNHILRLLAREKYRSLYFIVRVLLFTRNSFIADAYLVFVHVRHFAWVRAWSLNSTQEHGTRLSVRALLSGQLRLPCVAHWCALFVSWYNQIISDASWCVVPNWMRRHQTFVSRSILLRKVRFCLW